MFGLFGRPPKGDRTPVHECGYAYPHHSDQPHYHVGHPRKKTQSMTKGTGPFDGDTRYANTGVPPSPPGTKPQFTDEVAGAVAGMVVGRDRMEGV
jgi:hypothetical protein